MVDANRKRTIDSVTQLTRVPKLQKLGTPSARRGATDTKPDYNKLINVRKLDFDAEKVCSVTLSPLNVYCCLSCGKYFSGRTERTPAFLHSVNFDHGLFVNMSTLEFYLLPQDIKIESSDGSNEWLDDIRFAIYPIFTPESIAKMPLQCTDLINGRPYIQGFVGISESQSNRVDHINVVFLALAHIQPIRDYLLLLNPHRESCNELISKLSLITKKLWSPRLFRPHVSPAEFVDYLLVEYPQVLNTKSTDPRTFLVWIIAMLSSCDSQMKDILAKSCLGRIRINKDQVLPANGGNAVDKKIRQVPFWSLTLDLPPVPLFKDGRNTNELPQVQLRDLITEKFIKHNDKITNEGTSPSFQLLRKKLPRYLFLHIDRFGHIETHFPVKDRNQTIVNFPLKLTLFNDETGKDKTEPVSYRLIANIAHEAVEEESKRIGHDQQSHWKIQLLNPSTSTWLEIDGINVTPRDSELLFLDETFLQVWEKI